MIISGGSILKLVYRSKEDYKNGKPKDVRDNIITAQSVVVAYCWTDILMV